MRAAAYHLGNTLQQTPNLKRLVSSDMRKCWNEKRYQLRTIGTPVGHFAFKLQDSLTFWDISAYDWQGSIFPPCKTFLWALDSYLPLIPPLPFPSTQIALLITSHLVDELLQWTLYMSSYQNRYLSLFNSIIYYKLRSFNGPGKKTDISYRNSLKICVWMMGLLGTWAEKTQTT